MSNTLELFELKDLIKKEGVEIHRHINDEEYKGYIIDYKGKSFEVDYKLVNGAVYKKTGISKLGEYIANELSKISSGKKNQLSNAIANVLNLSEDEDFEVLNTYTNLGWHGDKFMFDKVYPENPELNARYNGKTPSLFETKGDKDEWNRVMGDKFTTKPVFTTVLSSSTAGLISGKLGLGGDDLINLEIVGDAASGKSRAMNLSASFLCNPELVSITGKDTDNMKEIKRAETNPLSLYVDERGTQGKMSNIDILNSSSGTVKKRLGGLSKYNNLKFSNPIIGTSTDSIVEKLFYDKEQGQTRRIIEIQITRDSFFRNAEEADYMLEFSKENYGFGAVPLIKTIVSTDLKQVYSQKKKAVKKWVSKNMDMNNAASYEIKLIGCMENKFSQILTMAELISTTFQWKYDENDVLKVLFSDIEKKLEVKEVTEPANLFKDLVKGVLQNIPRFIDKKEFVEIYNETKVKDFGYIEVKGNKMVINFEGDYILKDLITTKMSMSFSLAHLQRFRLWKSL